MELCVNCNMEDKLSMCCCMHPETFESKELILKDNSTVKACPNLDGVGLCVYYDNRPSICENYICPDINKANASYYLPEL